jgi:hypothetical protein
MVKDVQAIPVNTSLRAIYLPYIIILDYMLKIQTYNTSL